MLCGTYDPAGRVARDATRNQLALAADTRRENVHLSGPLGLASSAGAVSGQTGIACGLVGSIDNIEALAESSAPAEARPPIPDVLAALWRRWGVAMLGRLRGDFALALWDAQARRGVVARDQLGSGAIYFAVAGERLMFASEVCGVLRLLPTRPAPDETALSHWLAVSGPPGESTLYSGIRRLREGRVLRVEEGRWREERYWAPSYAPPAKLGRGAAAAGLRERLDVAVGRRLTEDGSCAVMLSGGLDSSAVAGLAADRARAGGATPAAYSAVFPRHPSADESGLIDRLTATLGIKSVRLAVEGGSPLAGSLSYLRAWELPPSSPNLFFWLPLLRRAKSDGVDVLLDGEGGDELFGTAHYLLADRLRSGRPLAALRLARSFPGAGAEPPWRPVLAVLRRFGVRGVAIGGPAPKRRPPPEWLSPALAHAYDESTDAWDWARAPGPRWWSFLQHQLSSPEGAVLARDQVRHRAAMVGIEARHPLLDLDVIEYVLALDPSLAFDPHMSRPLLRDSVAGVVPDDVRLRPRKSNFDAPFHEGLLQTDRSAAARLLTDRDAELARFVDLSAVKRALLDSPGSSPALDRRARALYMWRLVTAECWLRSQVDRAAPAEALAGLDPGQHAFEAA